ncbi:MAG: CBS domain-containing protein [Dehalococcoidia bacterium]|nr:CBS domain-containing protein [Dehalococcoidia bacterium]
MSLQLIVDELMVGRGHRAVIVADNEAVLGILSISDVRKLSRSSWGETPARDAMTPREEVVTVNATDPALVVLEMIAQQGLNQIPVLEEGRMIGLITRRELLERIQMAEQLRAEQEDRDPVKIDR